MAHTIASPHVTTARILSSQVTLEYRCLVPDTHRYGSVTLVSIARTTMVPSRVPSASPGNAVTARTSSALSPGGIFNRALSRLCRVIANDTIDSNGSFGGNSTRTLLAVRNPSFVTFTYVKLKPLLVLLL